MTIHCRGEELILSKEKAIYWPSQKTLIISDLHIGKSAHFRKSGIQVPATIGLNDLIRLSNQIALYCPEILLITGDMFHHTINSDVDLFQHWRQQYDHIRILLVKGNHDTLKPAQYEQLNIEVYDRELIVGPFRFIHDKPEVNDGFFNITGHIHPGITIHGKARQKLRFPCFYFSKNCAVLPAFSAFTGLSRITAEDGASFYAITPMSVVKV
ncbi:MAG: ligase-associated DNA damage response endonuclease PdeM [Pedobacter sp.]|nr:MAG: ligase-associated DNA damage response endonuclease PdeM [Pedobacter sp.]